MKTVTLNNIPDALHAAIEEQARQYQHSTEEYVLHLLRQAAGQEAGGTPQTLEAPVKEARRKTPLPLKDVFDAMPPEARLSDAEAEFLNNLRYNTSPDLRWPE